MKERLENAESIKRVDRYANQYGAGTITCLRGIIDELREMNEGQKELVAAFKSVAGEMKSMTEEIRLLRQELSPIRRGQKSLEELKRKETGGPASPSTK